MPWSLRAAIQSNFGKIERDVPILWQLRGQRDRLIMHGVFVVVTGSAW